MMSWSLQRISRHHQNWPLPEALVPVRPDIPNERAFSWQTFGLRMTRPEISFCFGMHMSSASTMCP